MKKAIRGSITERNVAAAFANESMTVSRYSFFSKIAFDEGLKPAGDVFAEIMEDEKRHAAALFRFFEGTSVELNLTLPMIPAGKTSENISNSIKVENTAWNIRYPEFAKIAREEGFPEIAKVFDNLANDEKLHEGRLQKAGKPQ
ncbi:MAG TPA: rubrerythrin family protein [Syntrophales bacterium]|nr:rubrerythrin family protein [Syntrophales bacterium]